jgi:hypothetical protein
MEEPQKPREKPRLCQERECHVRISRRKPFLDSLQTARTRRCMHARRAMASQAVVEGVDASTTAASMHGARDADAADATLRKWFAAADRDADGMVSGVEAQRFFARCEPQLSQRNLAKIWALADQKRQGFLDRDAFCVAMRLVAQVQRGKAPSLEARVRARGACCAVARARPWSPAT